MTTLSWQRLHFSIASLENKLGIKSMSTFSSRRPSHIYMYDIVPKHSVQHQIEMLFGVLSDLSLFFVNLNLK